VKLIFDKIILKQGEKMNVFDITSNKEMNIPNCDNPKIYDVFKGELHNIYIVVNIQPSGIYVQEFIDFIMQNRVVTIKDVSFTLAELDDVLQEIGFRIIKG
jgi:hypothetical protein